jgi:uncharacterized repeat protein (TIGR02543 family)
MKQAHNFSSFLALFLISLISQIAAAPVEGLYWAGRSQENLDIGELKYGDGWYVGLGNGVAHRTQDGINWGASVISDGVDFSQLGYADGVWLAIENGSERRVYRSTDGGLTWAIAGKLPINTDNTYYNFYARSLIKAGGYWLYIESVNKYNGGSSVSGKNKFYRSSDNGINWVEFQTGTQTGLSSMAWGNGMLVAVGETGELLTSSDLGMSWTRRVSNTNKDLNEIAYGNGRFVAVGGDYMSMGGGVVLTSVDGLTWQNQAPNTTSAINTVLYGNGLFVRSDGKASFDGIIWSDPKNGYASVGQGSYGSSGWLVSGGSYQSVLGPVPNANNGSKKGSVGNLFEYQITSYIHQESTTTSAPSANSYVAINLPLGLSLNKNTGLVSGVPQIAGDYQVVVYAGNQNGYGNYATAQFTLINYEDSDLYKDSDGDGLTDYNEIFLHNTDVNFYDTDGDGYSDGEEVERGTNPNSYWDKPRVSLIFSSNGGGNIEATGLDDWYGAGYWYSYEGYVLLRSSVTLTAVADNGYVFTGWFGDAYGTSSPLNLQMDSSKSVQANFVPDYSDHDGDGLTNYEELAVYNTNPNASDTDGDGHSDAKEIQRGSDPSNSASIPEKLSNWIDSFDPISNKIYGGASFLINLPTASSDLPVDVEVKSGPATIVGNRVSLTGAGIVVLAANQPGNDDYKAANEVTVSFAVLDLKNMTGEYVGNFNREYFEGAQEAMNRNGQLSMKLAKGGAFTGSMVILGSRISIRGKFDAYGAAEISVSNKTMSGVFVDLSIEPMTETEFQLRASIRWDDETSSEFVCYPVAYTGTGGANNCSLAGKQINSLLISQLLSGIDFGHGFAKIKVSTNGTLTFAGRMADGSTVSGTSRLVKDEYQDLLAQVSLPLPAVKGLLHGVAEIKTDPEEGQYHLASSSEWTWVRLPQSRARVFKEGFAEKLNVYGQVWNYTKGQSALPEALDGFRFQVDSDSIVLEEPLELWGSWPSSNKPIWDYSPKGFTFKVNPITGDISGTAPRTINGKATKAATYQGLLLRPSLDTYDGAPLMGGGYILGTESSGAVEITTP